MIIPKRPKALILAREPLLEALVAATLARLGWDGEGSASREQAIARLKSAHFDVLITADNLRLGEALQFIGCLRHEGIHLPAIVMSAEVQALRMVANDLLIVPAVLLQPFTVSDLRTALGVLCVAGSIPGEGSSS